MRMQVLPLLTLQLRAVAHSIRTLNGTSDPRDLAAGFCLMMVIFAILFGARHATAQPSHPWAGLRPRGRTAAGLRPRGTARVGTGPRPVVPCERLLPGRRKPWGPLRCGV